MNIGKEMQKRLNDEKFMNKILEESRSLDQVYEKLGYQLSYLIATRSKKESSVNGSSPNSLYLEEEVNKLSRQKLKQNIIDKGFMTHSFNGYNLSKVKKHGLGTEKIYEKEIESDMRDICAALGDSEYVKNQGNEKNEIYYSAPGAKTFHYACGLSPERLWLGPLKQERGKALPITIGQTKVDYAMSVLREKIDSLVDVSEETKRELLKKGTNLINKLCSHKPVVALIPNNSKKYNLSAFHNTTKGYEGTRPMLKDVLQKGTGSFDPNQPISLFTENTNAIEFNNLGNFVNDSLIPSRELEFFEVDDSFVLMQKMAKMKGLQDGEKIDYFTGQKYIPQVEKVDRNDIEVVKGANPKDFQKEGIVIDKIVAGEELENVELDELD